MFHVISGHMIPYYHQVPIVRMAREDFLSTNSQDEKQRTLCIAILPMFQEPGHSSIATLSSLVSLTREQQVPTGLPEVGSVLLASSLCAHIWCSLKFLDGTQESATLPCPVGKGNSLHQPILAAELAVGFLSPPQMNCLISLGKRHP